MNATIRENILFGESYRPRRYERILKVCALKADLELLPVHDLTEVGDQGINLSGGQKQRITIARALYSQANTLILDDPLSALDYEVAQHVFQQAIVGQKRRTIILVTHRVQLVQNAYKVIVMDKGTIKDQGTVQQIEQTNPTLTKEWHTGPISMETKHRSKTAKDRWNLFRLVSKIGNQLKHRNTVHGSWFTDQEIELVCMRNGSKENRL